MRKLFVQFFQDYSIREYIWKVQTNKVTNKSKTHSFYVISLRYNNDRYTTDIEMKKYLKQIWNLNILDTIINNSSNCFYRSKFIVTDESMFYFKIMFDWEPANNKNNFRKK